MVNTFELEKRLLFLHRSVLTVLCRRKCHMHLDCDRGLSLMICNLDECYVQGYPSVQCAAVRTQSELMRVPPQNCDWKILEPVLRVSATCQGTSPHVASVPPTILVRFPFLEPEQVIQVPLWTAVPQVRVLEVSGSGQQPNVMEI